MSGKSLYLPTLSYLINSEQCLLLNLISTNLPKSKTCLLAQLRAGVLPLATETGRYYRKPVESRVCLVCNSNILKDGLHFICHSSCYERHRSKLHILAYNV